MALASRDPANTGSYGRNDILKNRTNSPRLGAQTPWTWGASLGVLVLSAGLTASACGGVSDVNTKHSSGGSGGSGGGPASGAGAAGEASNAGDGNTDGACEDGERRCDGDVPQACQAGVWTSETACAKNEACSGAGVCAAFRLLGAGIGTFGERPAEPVAGAALILKEQSLSAAPRVCNDKFCITGDVR
jgi:hypothetical protein